LISLQPKARIVPGAAWRCANSFEVVRMVYITIL
jgi:hypothetical protein